MRKDRRTRTIWHHFLCRVFRGIGSSGMARSKKLQALLCEAKAAGTRGEYRLEDSRPSRPWRIMPNEIPCGEIPPASDSITEGLPGAAVRCPSAKSSVGHPQPHRELTVTLGNCTMYDRDSGVPCKRRRSRSSRSLLVSSRASGTRNVVLSSIETAVHSEHTIIAPSQERRIGGIIYQATRFVIARVAIAPR